MNDKLKPCPFCGSHKIKDDVYMRDGRRVVCRECSASVGAFNPNANERAVALWNRRHQDQDTASTFERWVK